MKDDKKKMMILGVLALVMVAVGAFTFLGGGSSAAPAEVVSTETVTDGTELADGAEVPTDGTESGIEGEEGTEVDPLKDALASMPFEVRDPFSVPPTLDDRIQSVPAPVAQAPAPVQPEIQTPKPPTMHAGNAPLQPPVNGGQLPTFGDGENISLPPVVAKPQYRVKGIVLGARPMAVFEDSDGNQRLVPNGGSVDGDTRVVAIEKGRVTVSYKGKRHTLVIEEEARND